MEIDAILKRLENSPKVYGQLKETADYWLGCFCDTTEHVSGWGHNYFCAECSSEITFDLNQPHAHICPSCGYRNEGCDFDEAWVYRYRHRLASDLSAVSLVYLRTKEEKYLSFICDTLSFYAKNYHDFPIHGRWAGKGKIMGQSLCEAVWAIYVLKALELIKPFLDKAFTAMLKEKLFDPLCALIDSQANSIHNIPLWLKSAVGISALFFSDDTLLEKATDGEYGIENQLEKGISSDFIWHENSLHYHFYALEGVTEFCRFLLLYKTDCADKRFGHLLKTVEEMYAAPVKIAFDTLRLPNPNDGWPDISLYTYTGQYLLANSLFHNTSIAYAAAKTVKAPQETNSEALPGILYGYGNEHAAGKKESVNLGDSCFALLRNGFVEVFLKYGLLVKSHSHPDIMGIEIAGLSHDLSNSGYGNSLTPDWYRHTISHNTVAVDGKDQEHIIKGKTLECSAEPGSITARAEGVYTGTDMQRSLRICNESPVSCLLYDRFLVHSNNEHSYDYIIHIDGKITAPEGEPADIGFRENGYGFLGKPRRLSGCSNITWEGETLRMTAEIVCDAEVYIFESPGNPARNRRNGMLLRQKGKNAEFTINYRIEKIREAPPSSSLHTESAYPRV